MERRTCCVCLLLGFASLVLGNAAGLLSGGEEGLEAQEVRERQKRAGLGLLERLEKEEPEVCEDEPCGRGMELHTRCNDTIDKKTLCIPCRYQFFKTERSFKPCRPCSVCAPGQVVSRWCTTKRNTLCSGDYRAPAPQLIDTRSKKKEQVEVPSFILTLIIPCALLLTILTTALVIYIRIKTVRQAKIPDKAPLTQNEDVDCSYGDEACPLPSKVAILDPKALPASVNIDSPVPGRSREAENGKRSYEFSFQVPLNENQRACGRNSAGNFSVTKKTSAWRKFCSTPDITDSCDAVLREDSEGEQIASRLMPN